MENSDSITIWSILRLPRFIPSGEKVNIGSFDGYYTTLLRVNRSIECLVANDGDPEVVYDDTFYKYKEFRSEGYTTVARAAAKYKECVLEDIEQSWLSVGCMRISLKNLYQKQK